MFSNLGGNFQDSPGWGQIVIFEYFFGIFGVAGILYSLRGNWGYKGRSKSVSCLGVHAVSS